MIKQKKRRSASKSRQLSAYEFDTDVNDRPKDELDKCFNLLKDICYEINAEKDSTKLKELSEQFYNSLPKHLKKTQAVIKDNLMIKEFSNVLKDFKEKKKEEL